MAERKTRYTIANNQQEFQCFVCGWPCYVGDRAVHIESDILEAEFTVCSVTCYQRELDEYQRHQDDYSRGLIDPHYLPA